MESESKPGLSHESSKSYDSTRQEGDSETTNVKDTSHVTDTDAASAGNQKQEQVDANKHVDENHKSQRQWESEKNQQPSSENNADVLRQTNNSQQSRLGKDDAAPSPKDEKEVTGHSHAGDVSQSQVADELRKSNRKMDSSMVDPVDPIEDPSSRGSGLPENQHGASRDMLSGATCPDSLDRQPSGDAENQVDENEPIDEVFKANTPQTVTQFEEPESEKELSNIHEPDEKREGQESVKHESTLHQKEDTEIRLTSANSECLLPTIETRLDSSNKRSRPPKECDENPFFTGRLPTLIPREHSGSVDEREENDRKKQDSNVFVNSSQENPTEAGTNQRDQTVGHNTDNERQITKSDTFASNPRPAAPTPNRRQGNQYSKEITKSELSPIETERTPTPSRKIKELIQGMKQPDKETSFEKHHPISPRPEPQEREHERIASSPRAQGNEMAIEPKPESVRMTVGDIASVSDKMTKTASVHKRESQFESMQHIQNITRYVEDGEKQSSLADKKNSNNNSSAGKEQLHKLHGDISLRENDMFEFQKKDHQAIFGSKQQSQIKFHQDDKDFNGEDRTITGRDIPYKEADEIKKSTTETELKNIIASAKTAFGPAPNASPRQQDSDTSAVSNMSVCGEPIERTARMKKRQQEMHSRNSGFSNDIPLICSSCLQPDTTIHNSGFCQVCKQYLCNTCIVLHTMAPETQSHEILATYCKNELKVKKYMNATAYCSDCAAFYCSKCAMEHIGFRQFRRHRIIQSSFFQKPTRKVGPSSRLDTSSDRETLDDSKSSSKVGRKSKQREKIVQDLTRYNPYRFAYANVLPSLYPGPKRVLGESYANRPKWPQSSIPTLPYLVQPKPMKERLLDAPYISQHKDYAKDEDRMAVTKMKKLKNTYGVHEDAQTYQLKAPNHTARPGRVSEPMDGLPDERKRTIASHTTGGKLSLHTTVNRRIPNILELNGEHCLSIPFPSGEKKLEIKGMTILLNGKLVVLDKNNSNLKLYNRQFTCKAALQFRSPLIDVSASNLCPTDVYAATAKHIYEISATKGMELKRKIKVEVKRIEGLACWKFGLLVVSKKTDITWEVRLMDYRGNLKSKLEILNPLTCEIETSALYHVTMTRVGKCLSISDTKNGCIITVDVITRKVAYESTLGDDVTPSYITADGENNVYVSSGDKVLELSKTGRLLGAVLEKPADVELFGCVVFNKRKGQLYIQTSEDTIRVYKVK